MSVKDELTAVQRCLDDLDRAIGRLEQHLGKGVLDVRRIRTDAGHLRESVALLRAGRGGPADPPHAGRPGLQQMVPIPDAPYDASLWQDADDEGLGCRDRRAP
ncbi:hypothetical protein AB0F13_01885 [Streptomyces sp. NPDC026206]|uniref:hypothetical protein n=1 Tax=Streptomyces sp. NPDC026206 TaxID=3157089 RepID=UPI0033CD1CEF